MRVVVALLLIALPGAAAAQNQLATTPARDSLISVGATRTVRIVPNRATFYVTVEGSAESMADALTRTNSKMTALQTALRALGTGVDLGTAVPLSGGANPNRGFPSNTTTPLVTTRATMRVQVSQLTLLARVFQAAADAGTTNFSTIAYESTASDSVRRAEIGVAIQSARSEAEAIATALGARIGGLVDLSSTGNQFFGSQPIQIPVEGSFGQSPAAPEVVVTVNVNVRFRLVR